MKLNKVPVLLLLFAITLTLGDMLFTHLPQKEGLSGLSSLPMVPLSLSVLSIAILLVVLVKGTKSWKESIRSLY